MLIHSFHLQFDQFQYTLIHGPNIPGSYAILLFTASNFTSITSHIHNRVLFCFCSISLFFLDLFLHWSPVAYWASTNLGSSSLSVLSFCLFILFMGFSRQEHWSGLPLPSAVGHALSALCTVTRRLGRPCGHGSQIHRHLVGMLSYICLLGSTSQSELFKKNEALY